MPKVISCASCAGEELTCKKGRWQGIMVIRAGREKFAYAAEQLARIEYAILKWPSMLICLILGGWP